jgi:hypothetical protein
MPGIIMIRASASDHVQIIANLTSLLEFVSQIPFPKLFMAESKFILSRDGAVMRGRDAETREIKSLHIKAGVTTDRQVSEFFGYVRRR